MAQLLDTTIRDGGNAIDHGYTEDDIRMLVAGLAASGISLIEVGHGVSVGLTESHRISPKVSDQRAVAIARAAAPHARIGVIAVPALTTTAALDPLYDSLDFVRVAVAPHEFDLCRVFVRDVLRHGKKVFVQLVKSHCHKLDSLVTQVRPLVDEGVDALYVVDTVGGMSPEDVARYVTLLSSSFRIPIGFHGHNNCSYALANSFAALSAGADLVDGTIGGIGRGAGNLQLELFVALLQQKGACGDIALDNLFHLSSFLWSRFPNVARGVDPIEVFYAINHWDSLSKEEVLRTARGRQISAFALIRAVAKRAKGFLITHDDIREAADAVVGAAPSGATAK
jgi:4-hydroxy 2-oxovalerate aldolase